MYHLECVSLCIRGDKAEDRSRERAKVKANVYRNFRHQSDNRENLARGAPGIILLSRRECLLSIKLATENKGLRVAERAGQIATVQTANNSLSVAARITDQNEAAVFTTRFHEAVKKKKQVCRR